MLLRIAFSLIVSSVLATTFVNRPMSEAVKEASNIVRGKTGESYSDFGPDHKKIYTYTHIAVTEVLKGDLKDTRILVRSPGGSKDGIEMHVPGAAQFDVDEDVVLLLGTHNADDDSYDIPGFTTGKYNVVTGDNGQPMLVNSLGSAAIYDPRKAPGTLSYNARVPLEVFRHIAKGEDVPEAQHRQFEQSGKDAPNTAFEAGHRHPEIRARGEKPAPVPSSAPTVEPAAREPVSRARGLWVPLSFAVVALLGSLAAYFALRSKD